MEDQVIILMATYNGEAYLAKQLDSLLSQTHVHWQLYVRDDGSSDGTQQLLQQYAQADHRIKVLDIPGQHGSPALNFSVLFNQIAPMAHGYLMFADQDDLWEPHKIACSLYEMKAQENAADAAMPLLIYSHFQYIDERGEAIGQTLSIPPKLHMRQLLVGNHAYGCTMLLNTALIAKIGKMPENVPYHDYWIALVACAFGKTIGLAQPLLLYRQHQHNASSNLSQRGWKARFQRYFGTDLSYQQYLRHQFQLIQLFYQSYRNELQAPTRSQFSMYINAMLQSNRSLIYFWFSHGWLGIYPLPFLMHFFTILKSRQQIIK